MVVADSSNVTAIADGVVQAVVAVVDVPVLVLVPMAVPEGHMVLVAVLQVPVAEPLEQAEGRLAEAAPQDAGSTCSRAL